MASGTRRDDYKSDSYVLIITKYAPLYCATYINSFSLDVRQAASKQGRTRAFHYLSPDAFLNPLLSRGHELPRLYPDSLFSVERIRRPHARILLYPDATIKNNIINGRSFLAMGEASLPGVFVYVYSYALDDESDSEW